MVMSCSQERLDNLFNIKLDKNVIIRSVQGGEKIIIRISYSSQGYSEDFKSNEEQMNKWRQLIAGYLQCSPSVIEIYD